MSGRIETRTIETRAREAVIVATPASAHASSRNPSVPASRGAIRPIIGR